MNLTETIELVEQEHQKSKVQADALWAAHKAGETAWLDADRRRLQLATCLETLKSLSTPETN